MKRFLKDFRGEHRHDDLAAKCAVQLAGKDLAVAESIGDPARRAETLAKLYAAPPEAR